LSLSTRERVRINPSDLIITELRQALKSITSKSVIKKMIGQEKNQKNRAGAIEAMEQRAKEIEQ
jgi:hypothetical protein